KAKLEQAQSLRDLATKASTALTGLPSSATRNVHGMEDAIAKMVDLKDEIGADIIALVELKQEISATIGKVTSAELRTLLELRYVCGKTWEDIADGMHYGVRNVHILHGAALRDVEKIFDQHKDDE
ncbi:MAG: hypothetical protein FWF44_08815, partial [Defluviitaleaceae bacterium]|nr:hypothetical protein [Defluviitaleaceae bacterium]